MATLNGLPVYKLTLSDSDELTGVEFISLVESPAIESNFVKFSKSQKVKLSSDNIKQNLTGAFMIPDLPIYRFDKTHGEYYVVFDKEEIEKIASKFLKEQKTINFNYEHQTDSQINAYITETWFAGKNDKSKDLGFDYPEGSWVGTVHIDDKDFWNNEIVTENVKGFSIEGYLDLKMNKIKNINMNKIKFAAEAKTKDGVVIYTSADAFAEGVDCYIMDGEDQKPLDDGDYEMENGAVITVASGKVSKMVEAVVQEEVKDEAAVVEHALTPEDMQAIADVVNQINSELIARVESLEQKIVMLEGGQEEMSKKFSYLPAVQSATSKTDLDANKVVTKKQSIEDKAIALNAIIKKQFKK